MPKPQILVVEDAAATASLICHVLQEKEYEVKLVSTLKVARFELSKALPNLLILDRGLPDGDGLDFIKELRSSKKMGQLPVLMLTAQNELEERVAGLSGGADDYLGKPFNTQELSARVDALLRRAGHKKEVSVLTIGDITLDSTARKATLAGKALPLSEKEFNLLWCFGEQKNVALSREFLLQHVWGYEEGLNLGTKVVDVTLSHLKEKIGKLSEKIVSVRGLGYRLED